MNALLTSDGYHIQVVDNVTGLLVPLIGLWMGMFGVEGLCLCWWFIVRGSLIDSDDQHVKIINLIHCLK